MWSVQYGSSQYTGKLMNHMKTKRMSDSRCPPTRSQASVTYVISDQSGHNYIPVTIRWSHVYKYVCPAGSAWLGGWARGTPDSPPLNSIAHPCIPQLSNNPCCPPQHTQTHHTPHNHPKRQKRSTVACRKLLKFSTNMQKLVLSPKHDGSNYNVGVNLVNEQGVGKPGMVEPRATDQFYSCKLCCTQFVHQHISLHCTLHSWMQIVLHTCTFHCFANCALHRSILWLCTARQISWMCTAITFTNAEHNAEHILRKRTEQWCPLQLSHAFCHGLSILAEQGLACHIWLSSNRWKVLARNALARKCLIGWCQETLPNLCLESGYIWAGMPFTPTWTIEREGI